MDLPGITQTLRGRLFTGLAANVNSSSPAGGTPDGSSAGTPALLSGIFGGNAPASQPAASPITSLNLSALPGIQVPVAPLQPAVPVTPAIQFPPLAIDINAPRFQGTFTETILARSAYVLLEGANRENLDLAMNTLVNNKIYAPQLLGDLVRGPFDFDQVKAELARGWPQADVQGFARRFNMPAEQLDVMDLIVSLGILNNPNLETLLRSENRAAPTQNDFLANRRVVWQSVQPGTVLNPPYVILIAVEAVDTAPAEDAVNTILGGLATYTPPNSDLTYKLPQAAADRLTGAPNPARSRFTLTPAAMRAVANLPLSFNNPGR